MDPISFNEINDSRSNGMKGIDSLVHTSPSNSHTAGYHNHSSSNSGIGFAYYPSAVLSNTRGSYIVESISPFQLDRETGGRDLAGPTKLPTKSRGSGVSGATPITITTNNAAATSTTNDFSSEPSIMIGSHDPHQVESMSRFQKLGRYLELDQVRSGAYIDSLIENGLTKLRDRNVLLSRRLSDPTEILYLRAYITSVGKWLDILSSQPMIFSRIIPWISVGYPVLLNLVLALGALNASRQSNGTDNSDLPDDHQALYYYNQGCSKLTELFSNDQVSRPDHEICLFSCILVQVFEMSYDPLETKIVHNRFTTNLMNELSCFSRASKLPFESDLFSTCIRVNFIYDLILGLVNERHPIWLPEE